MSTLIRALAACVALLPAVPAQAQPAADLVALINHYRAAPGPCEGAQAAPVPPLRPHPVLAGVRIGTGVFLEQALERAGYPVAQAEAISISGPSDATAVMAAIERRYCRTLLARQFSAIGARRNGDEWQIIVARPAPPSLLAQLPPPLQAGQAILAASNLARASGRSCGELVFPPAAALSWNVQLGAAALAHSGDMVSQHYFNHQDKQGRMVGERALQAGYRWRAIAENIAVGQESAEEVVAGWLNSPGHCANIMRASYTEMGAAYAVNTGPAGPRAYWTQVFGTPR